MKKLLLFFALAFAVLFSNGQTVFNSTWYYDATATAGELVMTNNGANSIAFNPVTGKLYVANRGDEIYIIDPDAYTGTISSLQKSGLPKLNRGSISESFRFNKVRVDADGVIYATALQTNGVAVIYRWASESATPTVKSVNVSVGSSNVRVGESFALYGSGNNTYLYVAGNRTTTSPTYDGRTLSVFKVTAGVVNLLGIVDMSSAVATVVSSNFYDIAGSSISAEAEDVLWVSVGELGVTPRRIKLNLAGLDNTGATSTPISSFQAISTIGGNFIGVEFTSSNNQGYAISYGSRSNSATYGTLGYAFHVYSTGLVNAATATLSKTSQANLARSATYVSNSGISDVAVRTHADNTRTVYFLATNNGLGAFKSATPLPVTLTSFDASLVKGQSTLTWGTAAETNNKGFELYRATEGTDFKKIDFIAAKSSNGNSATALTYTYVDRTAKAGVNYYKLKQLDLDGKSETFEKIVSVDVKLSTANVVVYPNPATSYVNVNLADDDYKNVKYDLFDLTGKKVLSEVAKASQQDVSVAALPAGVYYLKITKNGAEIKTAKIIKQ